PGVPDAGQWRDPREIPRIDHGRDAAAADRAARGHRRSRAVSRFRLEWIHDGAGAVRRRRPGDEMRRGLDRIWTRTGPRTESGSLLEMKTTCRRVLAACALAAAACGVLAQQCPLGSTW